MEVPRYQGRASLSILAPATCRAWLAFPILIAAFTSRRFMEKMSRPFLWWRSKAAHPMDAILFGRGHSGMKSKPLTHVGLPCALWCLQHRSESKATLF